MAKNYATIYGSGNDAVSVNQAFYLKEESIRGTFTPPAGTDFLYTRNGGTITFSQAFDSSEHRSGRHHSSIIKQKKTTEWSIPTYVNIDLAAVQGATEIDQAVRTLWKSVLGRETIPGGLLYDAQADPSITFTLIEVGDHWSKQSPACWVDTANCSFPGDGQAGVEWSGRGATTYYVGIGKSSNDNTTTNTFVCDTPAEANRFPVGAMVMFVSDDGTTRVEGTDTAPRLVTASDPVTGNVTVDGAVFATMDGVVDYYMIYWEPEAPTAINQPITGLEGSIALDTLSVSCVRSLTANIQNNHEAVEYCYGTDQLASPFFIPAERLTVEVGVEVNMNANLVEFLNRVQQGIVHDIDVDLGEVTGRHMHMDLNVIFSVPEVSVPDSGSIPVTFSGNAYETATGAADEIAVSFL